MTVTPFHAFEIAVYSILNLLPYALLSLLMFRDSLRFDRLRTALLTAALCAVQVLIGFCATVWFREYVGVVNIAGYLVYICFFLLSVRVSAGALAFLLFLLANYASFLVTAAKFLEHLAFPALAVQSYRWSFALALLAVQLLTMPFMAAFIYREIRPALSRLESGRLWRYLWVIPFTFYLTWFYVSYFATGISPAEMALRPMTVVFLLLINLGALVVYYAVAKMVDESAQRLRLEQDNHALAVRNLQLSHLSERMDEARRARHDLRQHYGVLLSYADAGDFDAVRSYLEQFRQMPAAETSLCYCDNPTVNAVVVYYLDRAAQGGGGDFGAPGAAGGAERPRRGAGRAVREPAGKRRGGAGAPDRRETVFKPHCPRRRDAGADAGQQLFRVGAGNGWRAAVLQAGRLRSWHRLGKGHGKDARRRGAV